MRCFSSTASACVRRGNLLSPFCKANLCGALEFSQPQTRQSTQTFYFPLFFLRFPSLRNDSRVKAQNETTKNGGDAMVNGENLFYILKISLRLSHSRLDKCTFHHQKCFSQMLHRVGLMWKMLLMFNVWQRFLLDASATRCIINEQFWLRVSWLRGERRRWCSTIWATYF